MSLTCQKNKADSHMQIGDAMRCYAMLQRMTFFSSKGLDSSCSIFAFELVKSWNHEKLLQRFRESCGLVWSFKTLLHNQLCTTNPDTSMLLSSTQETHRATEKQKHQELSPCYMKTDPSTYAISHVWQGRTPFQHVSTMFNKGLYNSKYVNRVLKLTAAMYSGWPMQKG